MYLLESPWRGDSNKYKRNMFFLKNNMGISMKNTQSADNCADQIDVITNFAVIMNVVIKRVKRVHCTDKHEAVVRMFCRSNKLLIHQNKSSQQLLFYWMIILSPIIRLVSVDTLYIEA